MVDATATSLTERLHARIKRDGPMTFHDWMKAALYDVHEGYYCRGDRIRQGRAGDYRTAPETTPLFAKTFAHYFARLWQEFGSPSEFVIIEAGAGGGDFANGVLQALQSEFADLFSGTRYLIDEISDNASAQIAAKLSEFHDHVEFRRLSEITDPFAQGIVFSNELIDA